MTKHKKRIAIPKGSLFQGSKDLLKEAGIDFTVQERKLIFPTNVQDVEVLLVRPSDVPVYVENGAASLGIVGSDVLGEQEAQVLTLAAFPFGYCELVIAVPKDVAIKQTSQIPDYCKVATKFPNLTKQYFRHLGLPVEIIELYGSIEIAPLTGLSEAIVDLVATGKTLQENGLIRIETISQHSARLIANRVSWQIDHDWIVELLSEVARKKTAPK
jgi:ATP phosphoribosyltransferase